MQLTMMAQANCALHDVYSHDVCQTAVFLCKVCAGPPPEMSLQPMTPTHTPNLPPKLYNNWPLNMLPASQSR
jgi:hypothetical protein